MSVKETLLKMSELVNELDAIVFDEGEFSSEFLTLLTRAPETEQAAELDKLKEEAYFLRCRVSHLENLVQQLQKDRERLKRKHKYVCETNANLVNYVQTLKAENEKLKNDISLMEQDCCC